MAVKRTKTSTGPGRGSAHGVRAQGKITKTKITSGMVEERARQLALIAGRTSKQVTGSDRRQAKRELLGAVHRKTSVRPEEGLSGSQWGAPPTSSGHRVKPARLRDDQFTKELVEEGVEEAEHDQMVAARKARK